MTQIRGDHEYRIRLGNGQSWQVFAASGAESWVELFASILGLKQTTSDRFPKLIFTLGDSNNGNSGELPESFSPAIREKFPQNGWAAEDKGFIKMWTHVAFPDSLFELKDDRSHEIDIVRIIYALSPVVRHAQLSGGLLFHSALAEYKGKAVLLAGTHGRGKSTCCDRLPSTWKALCDDETLVVRKSKNDYLAHPFPTWVELIKHEGKITTDIELSVPLAAVFFLEQSKADRIEALEESEAAILTYQSSHNLLGIGYPDAIQNGKAKFNAKMFDNACALSKAVPAFRLHVSRSGRFWEGAEEILTQKKTQKRQEKILDNEFVK